MTSAPSLRIKKRKKAYIDAATGVLPHQLVRIMTREFYFYLRSHWERLGYNFSIEEIENIGQHKKALCNA